MPLSADYTCSSSHPAYIIPVTVKGMVMTLLSESLVQVIFGVGLPVALHFSDTTLLSFTVWLPEIEVMFGSPIKKVGNRASV